MDKKRIEWTNAINQVVSDKYETLKNDIIDCMLEIEEKYNAGIDLKITNVPDLRFLTILGQQRHFFLIRKSYEMHFYLSNPAITLKKYPFIRDKKSPKNHFQIIGRDVPYLSKHDIRSLILNSFSFISGKEISEISQEEKTETKNTTTSAKPDDYHPTKSDLQAAIEEVKKTDPQVPLGLVMDKIQVNCQSQGYSLAPYWQKELRKNIEKWYPSR